MGVNISVVRSNFDVEHCIDIRRSVFCGLMHLPSEAVIDGDDKDAVHVLAQAGTKPVGSGRLVNRQGEWWLELVAVLPAFRKMGTGRGIFAALMEEAARLGVRELRVKDYPQYRQELKKMGFDNGVIPVQLDQG